MKRLFSAILLTSALISQAAEPGFNEAANARVEIAQALAQSATTGVPVLVVFGANWCGDSTFLDMAIRQGPTAPLVANAFRVVKVDVGRFDRNVELAQSYGVPVKIGIPAIVVISPKNQALYATPNRELADARKMGEKGVYEFFKGMIAGLKTGS